MKCPKCGNKIRNKAKTCVFCGKPIFKKKLEKPPL